MDFPVIGEKELFYTYIIRYHYYSGNVSLQSSFKEFFGRIEDIDSVLYPTHIEPCLKALHMDTKEYINEHSVLPYYKVFMKQEIYDAICNDMLNSTKSYTNRLRTHQYTTSKIKSDRLFYCPKCLADDMCYENIKTYQQIRGVHVCAEHRCYLNSISLIPHKRLLHMENWDMEVKECENEPILQQVAKDVEYIINTHPDMNNSILRDCLFGEAICRTVFRFGKWKEQQFTQWQEFYERLPVEYKKYSKKISFQRFADKELSGAIEPIEYILFIQSLFGSFERFVEICM